MDIEGLMELLQRIETGGIECIACDLPEPSPLSHEILNAKPYAFLDNAPLEERRTQAVYTRRANEASADAALGILDAAAIERVCEEAWPRASNADELHEALLLLGVITEEEAQRCLVPGIGERDHPLRGPAAIELSPGNDDPAVISPSPPPKGGEGRGEEGCWTNSEAPLPNPLPVRASRGEGGGERQPKFLLLESLMAEKRA